MSEVTIAELNEVMEQFSELKKEVEVYRKVAQRLEHETELFKQSNSSRRGLVGATGAIGAAGRDAVIRIIQSDNTVKIIDDPTGKIAAEIITVPGKDGAPGRDGVARDGRDGAEGADGHTPTEEELVAIVTKVVKKMVQGL